jgi:hypothetical protein
MMEAPSQLSLEQSLDATLDARLETSLDGIANTTESPMKRLTAQGHVETVSLSPKNYVMIVMEFQEMDALLLALLRQATLVLLETAVFVPFLWSAETQRSLELKAVMMALTMGKDVQ